MPTELMARQSVFASPFVLDNQPANPTQLIITITHISEYGDVTIYGIDNANQNATEEISGNGSISGYADWSFTTLHTFESVSQIVLDSFVDGHIEITTT
jgi:hypothetical protein